MSRKCITWEDLADFYKEKTGGNARIHPMDEIADWAEQQPEIEVTEDGYFVWKKDRKQKLMPSKITYEIDMTEERILSYGQRCNNDLECNECPYNKKCSKISTEIFKQWGIGGMTEQEKVPDLKSGGQSFVGSNPTPVSNIQIMEKIKEICRRYDYTNGGYCPSEAIQKIKEVLNE